MTSQLTVTIGKLPISIHCGSDEFIAMLRARYGAFAATPSAHSAVRIEVELTAPAAGPDDDLQVSFEGGCWMMRRGDFTARWDPVSGRGAVRQAAYPYAIDAVMRIIHSLMLARGGGFLLHSASAVRNGRAVLFSGVSGAGKTTISRLAPPDAILLTDEISYVRGIDGGYRAFGTPFAGELGIAGEDIAAPIGALYFLRKAGRSEVAPVDAPRAAARILRDVLFFARDAALADALFATVCDFLARVPVFELSFEAKPEVWDLVS